MVTAICDSETSHHHQSTEIAIVCDLESQNSRLNILKKYRGLIYGTLYALFLSIIYLIVKSLGHYHPINISLWRNAAIVIPTPCVLLFYQFKNDRNSEIFSSVFPINNREKVLLAVGLVVHFHIYMGYTNMGCLTYITVYFAIFCSSEEWAVE